MIKKIFKSIHDFLFNDNSYQKEFEAYLNGSQDIYEVEDRIRRWNFAQSRGKFL
jgi:hypothetical protein